mmetsp:Transcript_15275/g.22489  ORF Transcript_15275/g.22489 Transcript_15275/m.22489 type:complete len:90 (-) Transcript_15275:33-302(-)
MIAHLDGPEADLYTTAAMVVQADSAVADPWIVDATIIAIATEDAVTVDAMTEIVAVTMTVGDTTAKIATDAAPEMMIASVADTRCTRAS